MVVLAVGLVACGGGERQDADEPAGNFPVQGLQGAASRSNQQLANSANLELGIENSGTKTIPNLAVTIYTGKIKAGVTATGTGQGSFNIRLDNPNLSNPNRPVWVLENKYPKLLAANTSPDEISQGAKRGGRRGPDRHLPVRLARTGREQGHHLAGDARSWRARIPSTTRSRRGSGERRRPSPPRGGR